MKRKTNEVQHRKIVYDDFNELLESQLSIVVDRDTYKKADITLTDQDRSRLIQTVDGLKGRMDYSSKSKAALKQEIENQGSNVVNNNIAKVLKSTTTPINISIEQISKLDSFISKNLVYGIVNKGNKGRKSPKTILIINARVLGLISNGKGLTVGLGPVVAELPINEVAFSLIKTKRELIKGFVGQKLPVGILRGSGKLGNVITVSHMIRPMSYLDVRVLEVLENKYKNIQYRSRARKVINKYLDTDGKTTVKDREKEFLKVFGGGIINEFNGKRLRQQNLYGDY